MAYVAPEVWYQQPATFYAAAGALIGDQRDRVLLVKPTYRDHWTPPPAAASNPTRRPTRPAPGKSSKSST